MGWYEYEYYVYDTTTVLVIVIYCDGLVLLMCSSSDFALRKWRRNSRSGWISSESRTRRSSSYTEISWRTGSPTHCATARKHINITHIHLFCARKLARFFPLVKPSNCLLRVTCLLVYVNLVAGCRMWKCGLSGLRFSHYAGCCSRTTSLSIPSSTTRCGPNSA